MTAPTPAPMESDVLFRFVSGGSSAAERMAVTQWMMADPANRREVELLARAWALTTTSRDQAWSTGALWSRIEAELDAPSPARATPPGSVSRRSRPLVLVPASSRWRFRPAHLAAAATFLVAAALGVRATGSSRAGAATTAERTYTTRAGERAEVRLVDGTKVVLGGASTLRIPEAFGRTSRDLHLDGEAFFEVTHDSTRLLRVHTPRSVAEDLGTRFVVTAFSSDAADRIAVTDGIVAVQGSEATTAPVVLRANDVGHVSSAGVVVAERNAGAARYLGWMTGVVAFDDEPLADAVKVLKRQFDVDIRITDRTLAARRFTGSIRAASLHADLRGLASLLDARYERQGDEVVLSPQKK